MKRQNDEISQSKEEQKNEPKEMEAKKADIKPAPRAIKWGNKTLKSGINTSIFKSSSLFNGIAATPKNKEPTKEKDTKDTKSSPFHSLKWGHGKSSLLEKAEEKVAPIVVPQTEIKQKDNETSTSVNSNETSEDTVYQLRVKAFILEDNEYKPRGKGILKINKFIYDNEITKYQIVMRREGEEGGVGTVLVINSLLYKTTPVKDMGNGFLLISIPESKEKIVSFLLKPTDDKKFDELKSMITKIIKSIHFNVCLNKSFDST